ncbi:DM13 domain-containing protein [Spirulina major]|uniref:DM13 domain-containing protein n=1 Tax=Spirulina major TaxID=270636 RepID=UPI0009341B1A|nr:DM13 domain-containing protein [Spirulina major]
MFKFSPLLATGLVAFLVLPGCANSAPPAPEPAPAADQTSTPTEAPAPVADGAILRTGSWQDAEHPTSGTVTIEETDGDRVLILSEDFKTDPGPDLTVVLHKAPNILEVTDPPAYGIQEGDYILLDLLASPTGEQTYAIPADVDLETYQSAAIWCREFNATFGVASLITP